MGPNLEDNDYKMINDDLKQGEPEEHQPAAEAAVAEHEPSEAQEPVAEESQGAEPMAGTPRLIVKRSGVETDTEFPLNPPSVIGRFDPAVGPIDVDLANLPEGVYVSRKHAKITCEDGVWMIQDLGSSNGTFVLHDDFERVEAAQIQDGQEIALGNARFVFRLS